MDVIRACLCFYDLYPFLFAQLSQNLPNIFFNLPVYCHPTILWRKNYVILASPCCVLQCFDILLFHMKRPPGFIVAVGRPQLYSTRRSFALYNFFILPGRAGGCLFAEANKAAPRAGVFRRAAIAGIQFLSGRSTVVVGKAKLHPCWAARRMISRFRRLFSRRKSP